MAMAQRAIGEVRPGVTAQWLDPDEEQALTSDISAQLAGLPRVIDSPETYVRAKESLPLLKRAETKVVSFFAGMKKAAYDAHKAITAKEAEQLKPITAARTQLSGLIYRYESEQERIRREEERRLAEEEKRRLEEQALAEAAAIEREAPEIAAQIVEQAIAAPAPVVTLPSPQAKVAGVSVAQNWQWRFQGTTTNEWDRLEQADRDRILRLLPREYLRPDDRMLTKLVKAMKGGTRVPGIESFDAGSVRVRG